MVVTGDKIFKGLAKKVNSKPEESRCAFSQGCIDLVKEGNHVYIDFINTNKLLKIINRNFFSHYLKLWNIFGAMETMDKDSKMNNDQCDLTLAEGKMSNPLLSWGIAKNSPYTKSLNKG